VLGDKHIDMEIWFVEQTVNGLAIIAAFASGYFWLRAARPGILRRHLLMVFASELWRGRLSRRLDDWAGPQSPETSGMNARAAAFAAAAAMAQGLAILIHAISN
jgi:hypothetical protein